METWVVTLNIRPMVPLSRVDLSTLVNITCGKYRFGAHLQYNIMQVASLPKEITHVDMVHV